MSEFFLLYSIVGKPCSRPCHVQFHCKEQLRRALKTLTISRAGHTYLGMCGDKGGLVWGRGDSWGGWGQVGGGDAVRFHHSNGNEFSYVFHSYLKTSSVLTNLF